MRLEPQLDQIKIVSLNHYFINHLLTVDCHKKILILIKIIIGYTDFLTQMLVNLKIKLVTKALRNEVRLNFQIDQKNNDLLILIKNF